jgi:hypothetical protein
MHFFCKKEKVGVKLYKVSITTVITSYSLDLVGFFLALDILPMG